MKNRTWIIIFAAVIVLCLFALLGSHERHDMVGIYRDGELIRTIDLDAVTEPYDILIGEAENVIHVEKGSVYVSSASCPDKVCVKQGRLSDNRPIVCLPHKLVIKYLKGGIADAVTG